MDIPNKKEIESLEFQIQHHEKMLDTVLKNDLEFAKAKKVLHTIRVLMENLERLIQDPETQTRKVAE